MDGKRQINQINTIIYAIYPINPIYRKILLNLKKYIDSEFDIKKNNIFKRIGFNIIKSLAEKINKWHIKKININNLASDNILLNENFEAIITDFSGVVDL